ncbi:caffeoylshikimate esterase-like [Zingiber officinale]|nr:caffeoylshikimate esterase-like [Zingiber officinale]
MAGSEPHLIELVAQPPPPAPVTPMGSAAPPPAAPAPTKYFWGDEPGEEEYYLSQGVQNQQIYFQSPHGRLFTQSFLPVDPATGDLLPVKALVFMTHGYGSDSGWLFQKVAIAYANWGYAVYCADLLGHGRSDGVRCYLGNMEAVAAASLSFFLSVRQESSHLPAFLFGESMGGAATLLMYLRSPDRSTWTGLIFSAPLFVIPDDMKPSRIHLFLYGLLFGLADTWAAMPDNKMVGKAIKDRDRLRVIASNPRRYTGRPRVGTMRELARLCEYFKTQFPDVTAPFLTVHGTDDGVASPEGSKMFYEKTASADKKLILYEGMYHSLIQGEPEENSSRVLADMRTWIDERVERYAAAVNGNSGDEERKR